jgi:hypothetical protein
MSAPDETAAKKEQSPATAENEQKKEIKSRIVDILRDISAKECPPVSRADIESFNAQNRRDNFPPPIEELLVAWLRYSKVWRYSYYTISVGIIVFAALATVLTDGDLWYYKWKTGAALLATIFGGLSTTLRPYSEHKKFDEAFAVLNTAKQAYVTNPNVSLCEVGKAVAYGETIIHGEPTTTG